MKKTALLIAALLALALFWAVPAFPGTVPASIVPEGAKWVVHLDMEKFVATDLFSLLNKDGKLEIKNRDLERWFKIDVPKDITGVTVFGLGPGDDKVVFAVAGRFDKAGIISQFKKAEEHQETAYGAYILYSIDDDECGAFVNDNLVVFSEGRAAVEKVLDTAGGKARSYEGSALSAWLKDVPQTAFISGALPDLGGLSREIGRSKILEKASGLFFMAQEKKEVLQVRLQVTADSPESARSMADVAQGLVAMAKLSEGQPDAAMIASLLEGIKFGVDGKVFKLEFERPAKEIAEMITKGSGFHGLHGFLD
ncbi:MAG TPA: hypothetical protein P5119_00715 [Candidatus Aminicenantes bacterium]|nr:hypothetical protein [Candidatus Aminicenantes bacterium]HRY63845.1 hypothetical protein [Candidatus Aminicenantes bacterium]HRZ70758.1 hypothetical protein [Candidatus Aminicenantes bacterium]